MDECTFYTVVMILVVAFYGGWAAAKDLRNRTREAEEDEFYPE